MKTFLSIGSGPGIGIATAVRFAREGFRIVLTSRNKNYVSEQVTVLRAAGYQAEGRFADASDVRGIAELIRSVESETGAIDVLHFNSAALHDGTLETQSVDRFIEDLTINIGAAFVAVKEASLSMAERSEGTILLTGGIFATHPNADYLSLSVGKAGLRNLVYGLFDNLKEKNIHIATVTVGTLVAAGSDESSDIAQTFWDLHVQSSNEWTAEKQYPSA
ncbi:MULTISPECIES: SDR family NAD(P)-dependent oxidoreductase [Rahnella]|jgi:NAD(P)-dependent dehydrogenase (short-subunit alcohol dehydrogenase family)|uniref:SDR family NAD(P)-dependent oxidoreductase n=1 Tax=Rahnella TaxID=34037 RepID=UPI00055FDC47|nr:MULTISPECIES: SDR family NAD(P)-dependent oxidoreductase [Rahnella]QQN36428.1 SDR family NAD(P)-dependent oxidoreductase [Rahnella aceris]